MRILTALFALTLAVVACGTDDGTLAEPPVCNAGELACAEDGATVGKCLADGTGFEQVEVCAGGAQCKEARCQCAAGETKASGACIVPGVEECPAYATAVDNGCKIEPTPCASGEVFAGGECVAVGLESCPAGFVMDADGKGCLVDEKPCNEGKEWYIGDGCIEAGLALQCGDLVNPWPAEIPEGEVLFVSEAGPEEGADGSSAKPFRTIQEAVDAAAPNSAVLVATGTYAGGIAVDKPLRILGKCAQYVTVDGAAEFMPEWTQFPGRYGLFAQTEGDLEIAGMTFSDSAGEPAGKASGVYVEGTTLASVHDVFFDSLGGMAVHLKNSADATVANIRVTSLAVITEDLGPDGQTCYGVLVDGGSAVTIDGSLFESTQGTDVDVTGSCPTVSHNRFEKRGKLGGLPPMGVRVKKCDTGKTVIEANRFAAKMTHAVHVEGGDVEISRNYIQGTVTDYDDINGPAVRVKGAKVKIAGNWVLENQFSGIALQECEGDVSGNRVESGLPSDPGLKGGDGIVVVDCDPGPVAISGNSIVANTRNGVLLSGSIAKVERNLILDTLESPAENAGSGAGIHVVQGADVIMQGNWVAGNGRFGIHVDDAYGSIADNVVADTAGPVAEDGRCSAGIMATGSTLPAGIVRNLVTGNFGAGVYLADSTAGAISDNVIEKSVGKGDVLAVGVVLVGSQAQVTSNWIRGNKDIGLLYDSSSGEIARNVIEENGVTGAGPGVKVQNVEKPPVEIHDNTFSANGFAGLVVASAASAAKGNAAAYNVANKEGLAGSGIWIEESSDADVAFNRVDGNKLAGIVATGADSYVSIRSNLVLGTVKGSLPGAEVPVQMSDGIALMAGAFGSAINNRSEGNGTAGIAYLDAEGATSGNELNGNGSYGLELALSEITQDASQEPNYFSGNKQGSEFKSSDREGSEHLVGTQTACAQD